MPSDVKTQNAQITEIFTRLDSGMPLPDDAHKLFELAAGLKIQFENAEKAAQQLKDIYETVKNKAKEMIGDGPKEVNDNLGKVTRLQGGTLKPRAKRNDPVAEVKKFVDKDGNDVRGEKLDILLKLGEPFANNAEPSQINSLNAEKSSTFVEKKEVRKDEEDEGAVQMQQFFTNVTASLIGAQQELNRQSLDYAARLDQRIPPAYYSIPSLKAEMKVGFSESKTKGMNLILFSSKEQRENHGESTLSFELVAVPPPPGTTRPELPPGFLLIGDEKEAVLDKIQATAGELLGKALSENFGNTRALAAVLRYAEQAGKKKYLIFWPSQTLKDIENKPDFWRNLLVLHLVEEQGQLQADPSVFDPNFLAALDKGKQYLLIPDTAGLHKLKPDELVAYINCFGDAVLKALKIFDEYYRAKA